jgi:hypothetical protein
VPAHTGSPMLMRSTVIWLTILILAFANGTLRELVLAPRLGNLLGGQLSAILLSIGVVLVTWLSLDWMQPRGWQGALGIGMLWVILTSAFEFLGGHFLFGKPWDVLLADYHLLQGRLWVLVLIATFLAPLSIWHVRL